MARFGLGGILARAVFRPGEVALVNTKVILEAPFGEEEAATPDASAEDAARAEEVYKGPTAEELRQEAEKFKQDWEIEKSTMISNAQAEADAILSKAREDALQTRQNAEELAKSTIENSQKEAEKQKAEAEAGAKSIIEGAGKEAEEQKKAGYNEGFKKGREEGFETGKAEMERLTIRMQVMLERIQDKRTDIFDEAEQQIIDLVLLTTRKVVKIIPEKEKNVVIENIKAALGKVKERGKIIIKINTEDLKLSTEHKNDFIKLIESGNSLELHEDNSIEPGGCIVQTDFGEIDARISSQLFELESKITELSPIKAPAPPV